MMSCVLFEVYLFTKVTPCQTSIKHNLPLQMKAVSLALVLIAMIYSLPIPCGDENEVERTYSRHHQVSVSSHSHRSMNHHGGDEDGDYWNGDDGC